MTPIVFVLIVPGLGATYFIFLRPILHAIPALKKFYTEADGFWAKLWALCGKSLTLAWSYILIGIGVLMQWLEPIANALGDPDIKSQVTGALRSDPKILGYVAMGISIITIAARLRSVARG
jgi:hypothetical protein